MIGRVFIAWIVTLEVATPHARADDRDAEAARRYDEGTRALRADRFGEAASAFDRAWTLRPHGATAFMAATAWESAGDPVRAADAWTRAAASRELEPERRARATRRRDELEQTLGTVAVTAPGATAATARLDDAPFAPLPARLHGRPGEHVLQARDADERPLPPRPLRLDRGVVIALTLTVPVPNVPPPALTLTDRTQPPGPQRNATRKVTSAAFAAVAVAAFVGSAVAWTQARDTAAEFERAPSWSLRNEGLSQVRWTNGLLAAGALATATAATLWFWPPASENR